MRKFSTVVLMTVVLVGSGIVYAPPVGAVVLSGDQLVADCNDDGIINVAVDSQYVGGGGDIIGAELFPAFPGLFGCMVDLERGVDLVIARVNLRAKGGAFFNIGQSSPGDTRVWVVSSTIDMAPELEPGGFLSIKTGCCGGFPSEEDTGVAILDSRLRGTNVELGASIAASRGRFWLSGSVVEATSTGGLPIAPDIRLRVSSPGANGSLRALRNVFKAPGSFLADTGGPGGAVWMVGNTFTGVLGAVDFDVAAGSSCTSFLNTPPSPC